MNKKENKYFKKMPPDRSFLDILHYELECLNDQADYKAENQEINAFLEAFLVHTRNLIYFLSDKGSSDDLKISDFKNKEDESLAKIEIDEELIGKENNKLNLDNIHKSVMHISKKRIEQKFGWYKNNIRNEINRCFREFIDKINENHFLDANMKREDFKKMLN